MEDGGKILQVFFLLLATSDAFGKSIEVMVHCSGDGGREEIEVEKCCWRLSFMAINFPVPRSQVLVA